MDWVCSLRLVGDFVGCFGCSTVSRINVSICCPIDPVSIAVSRRACLLSVWIASLAPITSGLVRFMPGRQAESSVATGLARGAPGLLFSELWRFMHDGQATWERSPLIVLASSSPTPHCTTAPLGLPLYLLLLPVLCIMANPGGPHGPEASKRFIFVR